MKTKSPLEPTEIALRSLLKKQLANLKIQSKALNAKINLASKMLASLSEKEAGEVPLHRNAQIARKFKLNRNSSLHAKVMEIASQLRERTGKPFRATELLRAVEAAGLVLPGKKSKLSLVSGMLAREMNRKYTRKLNRVGIGLYDVIEQKKANSAGGRLQGHS